MSQKITASELQRIALRLSNQCFVRHWLHWNYPCVDPWVMAIECRDAKHNPIRVKDLDQAGFEWDEEDKRHYVDRGWL